MMEKVITVDDSVPQVSLKRRLATTMLPGPIVKRLVGLYKRVTATFQMASNSVYDFRRFLIWSSAGRTTLSQTQARAVITIQSHRIEKGLALPAPRPGFGIDAVTSLIECVDAYLAEFGWDDTIAAGTDALSAYRDFNARHQVLMPMVDHALGRLRMVGGIQGLPIAGTKNVTRAEIVGTLPDDLSAFFASRHSVRQFAPHAVAQDLIVRAIRMAQKTPSVCNRQAWKVHVFSEPEQKREILKFQNGNRGFGDTASHLLIITVDLQHFTSAGERTQCWIDGGLFAMSVVYALHSLGLGTCMLNWSVLKETDRAVRTVAGIPDSQVIIMMIVVGNLPDEFTVAYSLRKGLEDVIVVHQGTSGGGERLDCAATFQPGL
jgi:nitroreductase